MNNESQVDEVDDSVYGVPDEVPVAMKFSERPHMQYKSRKWLVPDSHSIRSPDGLMPAKGPIIIQARVTHAPQREYNERCGIEHRHNMYIPVEENRFTLSSMSILSQK